MQVYLSHLTAALVATGLVGGSTALRAYWRKEAILDGTWQPPKIEVVG